MNTTTASAASLEEVTGFGANPGNLRMFLYVPDTAKAPDSAPNSTPGTPG
jgi:hypothetical protein